MKRVGRALIRSQRTCETLGHGRHADGGGLFLYVSKSGRSWVYRYSFRGSRPEMGLGSL
ncbi:MAG: Arm DNA-binding domain-containing protein, partial [Pseudomonadota bacterium]